MTCSAPALVWPALSPGHPPFPIPGSRQPGSCASGQFRQAGWALPTLAHAVATARNTVTCHRCPDASSAHWSACPRPTRHSRFCCRSPTASMPKSAAWLLLHLPDQGAFMAPLRWAVPLACRAAAQWSTPTRAQARDILILPTTPEPRRTGGAQNGASDEAGIAVKHVHSGDHPEADWGRHVLAAIQLGLDMLNDALPDAPPFEPDNTRIIATGLSNGGGAVLQAAGLDKAGLIDAVVAVEPNVHLAGSGRALYDYVTEAALLMPCALAHPQFDDTPFARAAGAVPPAWAARCQRLHDTGLLDSDGAEQQAEEALSRLNNSGWSDNVIATTDRKSVE